MDLTPGSRLRGGEQTIYDVGRAAWSTARHRFYQAQKVFWNYRDESKSLYEASRDEWLDVLVRAPILAGKPAQADLDAIAAGTAFELETVLNRPAVPSLPLPVDLIEVSTPASHGAMMKVPLLVLADPHGTPLTSGPPDSASRSQCLQLLDDVLTWVDVLHLAGLALDRMVPEDLFVHRSGGWTFLGTDHITLARLPDQRLELDAWSRLACQVLSGNPDQVPGQCAEGDEATRAEWARMTALIDRCRAGEGQARTVAEARSGPRPDQAGVRRGLARWTAWLPPWSATDS